MLPATSSRPACIALAALLLTAATVHAQTVQGVLTDAASGQPIEGAMLLLLDAQDVATRAVLSDERGRFTLRAPAAGTFSIRVDRIGYERSRSAAFTLRAGEILDFALPVAATPITLADISVTAADRGCAVRPGPDAVETARVWEEARKALAVTALVQRQRSLRFEGETFSRTLEPGTMRVVADTTRVLRGYYAPQPFISLSAADLAANGYVREVDGGRYFQFFAPSADVLLSDEFLSRHCLRLVRGRNETAGLVGLAFAPVRGARTSDIEGTLWLDARSARLSHLEFSYTRVDNRMPTENAGGRVEFFALPDGTWVISSWLIRVPILVEERVPWFGQSRRQVRAASLQDHGGAVLRAWTRAGPITISERADLAGVVHDSTTGTALSAAHVRLVGTAYTTTTDAAGRFVLTQLPAGVYDVEFWHARLDSLPVASLPPVTARVDVGQPNTVELAVPPRAWILAAACPPDSAAPARTAPVDSAGTVVGVVHDPLSGSVAPQAQVSFSWTEHWLRSGGDGVNPHVVAARQPWTIVTTADARGRFWICDVPTRLPITAHVRLADGRELREEFRLRDELQVVILGRHVR